MPPGMPGSPAPGCHPRAGFRSADAGGATTPPDACGTSTAMTPQKSVPEMPSSTVTEPLPELVIPAPLPAALVLFWLLIQRVVAELTGGPSADPDAQPPTTRLVAATPVSVTVASLVAVPVGLCAVTTAGS